MNLLGKIFGHQERLTPEDIASWLVSLQRPFFGQFYELLKQERSDVQRIDIPIEAVPEISFHGYLCHLAIVAIVYQDHLNDSKVLEGGTGKGADLFVFANRVYEHARKITLPEMRMDSKCFNPYPVVPFTVEFEAHLSDFTFYYISFFAELNTLRNARPDVVEYAEIMIAEMNTTNLLAKPISLAYYQAHRLLFSPGSWTSKYKNANPDLNALSVVLRTWKPWCTYFSTVPRRLKEFAGTRTPAF